jgi:tetratricopeptide (TPR) repeat protein/KaiC/GvpD/RAD55 family RecA-like ATPase
VDELGIPSKIKDIILRRLACLNFAQRRILDAASVIGEEFDVELLCKVLGQDILDVLETLNQIAHSTSLVRVQETRYRFDHARSRETLYEELSAPLKKGYHNRIAEKLENTKTSLLQPSDIAYHYAQAGNMEKAVKFALAAGKDELEKYSNAQAIKHFQYVIQNLREGHSENKDAAIEGLGEAYYASSMFKDATRTFEELADIAEPGIVKLRTLRKAMQSAFDQGDVCHLADLVKKAEPYTAADRLENARVLRWRGRLAGLQGKTIFEKEGGFMRDEEDALQVFEEEYSLWDVASVLMSLGNVPVKQGRSREGLAECLRSIALFDELGDFQMQMSALYIVGFAFSGSVLIPEALDVYAKIIALDEKLKMGNYLLECFAYAWSANLFVRLGDFEKGLSYLLRALELSEKTDSLVARGVVYSSLTKHYARIGEVKYAEQYFEKLLRLPKEIFNFSPVFGELTRAVFLAAKGQWKDFEELYERLKTSTAVYDPAWLPYVEWYYAWVLEKEGRLKEAQTQLEKVNTIHREAEEIFARFNLQSSLMVRREVGVGEEFEMRLDLVNVSRKPGVLFSVKGLVLPELTVTSLPANYRLENGSLETKNRRIGPFQVETLKLKINSPKPGILTLNPQVTFMDELGEAKTCKLNPITITVQPTKPKYELLPGRVPTGSEELDDLLFGGIPQNFAVALTSPSTDERELLIERFLEAGATVGETTFHITAETGNTNALAKKYPSNYYLFLCSLQADAMIQNLPNVFKLKGAENLTDIDIALTKAFRALDPSAKDSKRICIEVVSDALLQHHVVNTRRWLGALLPTLKSKGFTVLAVVDPRVHAPEELQAVLGVFDGEIRITEQETPEGTKQVLKVKRLINQKYSEKEVILNKDKL